MIDNQTPGRGYPLPAPTNRLSDDVLRLIAAVSGIDADVVAVLSQIAGRAPAVHGHTLGDVTGLIAALAGKSDVGHVHSIGSLTGVSISAPVAAQVLRYSGSAWTNAGLAPADVSGLAAFISATGAAVTALEGDVDDLIGDLATLTARVDDIDGGTF